MKQKKNIKKKQKAPKQTKEETSKTDTIEMNMILL